MEIEKCTGCAGCEAVCPTKAIDMKQDDKGFLYPETKKSLCIDCGKCEQICPLDKESDKNIKFGEQIFAAWSLDSEVRFNSTSGGIFSELAKIILKEKGVVVGAAYQNDFQVQYRVIEKEEELQMLRQSKYVEAKVTDEISRVKELLKQGRRVLFVGTPCKIAGLKQVVGEETENLYTCDFICRGSNSPIAYQKYLESLERQYESKIQRVWFKNKKDGWNQFGTQIEFENGKKYFANRYEDSYMRGYLKHNLYLRESCTECSFKGDNRWADITLADFWGVWIPEELTDVEKGISMVSINTENGQKLWNEISYKIGYVNSDKEKAIAKNWCANNSVQHGNYREIFWDELNAGVDFQNLIWNIEELQNRQDKQNG